MKENYDQEFMRIAMAVLKRNYKFYPQRLALAARLLKSHYKRKFEQPI
jgi:hypothetical protein